MIPKKRLKKTLVILVTQMHEFPFSGDRVILWATVKVSVKCYQSRAQEATNSVRCEIPSVM